MTLAGARAARGAKAVLANDGAEAWDLGDGVLGVTFKTKANSLDPDVDRDAPSHAAEKAEQDFRALVVVNQGEHFCVGANLFLVAMAAGNKDWDAIRKMVKALPGRDPAAEVRERAGRGRALRDDPRRRPRALLRLRRGAGRGRDVRGLVEVGVGLIPGARGTLNMLWRALEEIPEGAHRPPTYDIRDAGVQEHRPRQGRDQRRRGEGARLLPQDGRRLVRPRLPAARGEGARGSGSPRPGYHPPVPRAYKLPGESGIATLRMMIDTLVAGGYACEHDAKIARKLADVLCGGAGGGPRAR